MEKMPDWKTLGHDGTLANISRSAVVNRIPHAYLIIGPSQVGKKTLAIDIARLVNCISAEASERPCGKCRQCSRIETNLHADIRAVSHLDTTGNSRRTGIGIDQVREIQREVVLKPYEGKYRVFIIEGAETFTQEASNALLKMLEEPPEDVIFILLAESVADYTETQTSDSLELALGEAPDRVKNLLESIPESGGILPTIFSRCQTVELRPVPKKIIQSEIEGRSILLPDESEAIARAARGRIGWALEAVANKNLLEQQKERIGNIAGVAYMTMADKFSYAENLGHRFSRDREEVFQELELWTSLWRDVLMLRESDESHVTNLMSIDTIQNLALQCSTGQVVNMLETIQQTVEMLMHNVNPRMVLERLLLNTPRDLAD